MLNLLLLIAAAAQPAQGTSPPVRAYKPYNPEAVFADVARRRGYSDEAIKIFSDWRRDLEVGGATHAQESRAKLDAAQAELALECSKPRISLPNIRAILDKITAILAERDKASFEKMVELVERLAPNDRKIYLQQFPGIVEQSLQDR